MSVEQDPFRCQLKDGTWIESNCERALRFAEFVRNKEIDLEAGFPSYEDYLRAMDQEEGQAFDEVPTVEEILRATAEPDHPWWTADLDKL